jgi:hypothetical protein
MDLAFIPKIKDIKKPERIGHDNPADLETQLTCLNCGIPIQNGIYCGKSCERDYERRLVATETIRRQVKDYGSS